MDKGWAILAKLPQNGSTSRPRALLREVELYPLGSQKSLPKHTGQEWVCFVLMNSYEDPLFNPRFPGGKEDRRTEFPSLQGMSIQLVPRLKWCPHTKLLAHVGNEIVL